MDQLPKVFLTLYFSILFIFSLNLDLEMAATKAGEPVDRCQNGGFELVGRGGVPGSAAVLERERL